MSDFEYKKNSKILDYARRLQLLEKAEDIVLKQEHTFYKEGRRRWRFDFSLPCCKLAIEIDGMSHAQPAVFLKDIEKYNRAMVLGWRVLRFTPEMIDKNK